MADAPKVAAWHYEWKPSTNDNPWQTSVSLESPKDGTPGREYRNIKPLHFTPDSRAQVAAAGALVEVKALLEAVRRAKEAFQNQDELDLLPIQHRPTVRHLAEQMHKALGPFREDKT